MGNSSRKFEITLVSATNLPDVRTIGQTKVYAEVSIDRDPQTRKKTPTDQNGETNPRWDFPIAYDLREVAIWDPETTVVIGLYAKRTIGRDILIGEAKLPIRNLFEGDLIGGSDGVLSWPVDGTPDGEVNVVYRFGENYEAGFRLLVIGVVAIFVILLFVIMMRVIVRLGVMRGKKIGLGGLDLSFLFN